MTEIVRSPIRVHAFPSDDAEFHAFVADRVAVLAVVDPVALQQAIRERYPLATVTVRSPLASVHADEILWYAFRRAIGEPSAEGWWVDADSWAIIAADRTFVDATEALAVIAEVPVDALVGRRIEDFTNPDDPTAAKDIADLWTEVLAHGRADGSLRFNRLDGSPRELEYHVERDASAQGRFRAVIRER